MRILTFDGGGVRGILAARLVERLEAAVPGFAASVDMVAGTSVGSINAACIAAGMEPSLIVELFRDLAPKVFSKRDWLDGITHLDELVRAHYNLDRLADSVKEALGDKTTLGDLAKLILVPTFCLDNQDPDPEKRNWKPKFLHNFDSPGNDKEWLVWAALCASSAAPTYFESFLAPDGRRYVDGGMMDNNPAMSAVGKAVKAGALDDVCVLSIGTGFNPHRASGGDWGYKQWLLGSGDDPSGLLLSVIFDGMVGVPDYQVGHLLGRYPDPEPTGRYVRLDVRLADPIDLADVDRMDDLVEAANSVDISDAVTWLTDCWGVAAA